MGAVEFQGKLPFLANLILVLISAWIVAGWFVSNGPSLQVVGQSEVSRQPLPAMVDIQGNIFGNPSAKAVSAKPVVAPVVQSPLNVKLLGTVVAGESSAAVIEMGASHEQRVLFIGSTLQPGVKLHEVLADAIVLDRGGKFEKVRLEKLGGLTASPVTQTLQPSSAAKPQKHKSMSRSALPAPASGEFMKILSQARVTPHFVNGKTEGFLVSNIVPGSVYELAGLQNGDVVRKVNGQSVSNAQQAMVMYQELQKGGSISLEFLRAGQPRQLHYDFVR